MLFTNWYLDEDSKLGLEFNKVNWLFNNSYE